MGERSLIEDLRGRMKKSDPRLNLVHLTRLAAHKPLTGTEERRAVVLRDLSRDLQEFSDLSVQLACEYLRKDSCEFFPNARIYDRARMFEAALRHDRHRRRYFDAPKERKPTTREQVEKCRKMLKLYEDGLLCKKKTLYNEWQQQLVKYELRLLEESNAKE